MRRTIYFTCRATGKRAYRSEEEAERALDSCRATRQQVRRHVPRVLRQERRIYECDWCGGWHLSSKTEWSDDKSNARRKTSREEW